MSNDERNDWNRKIIDEFRANGGAVQTFGGKTLLLLHHTGAKSGTPYVTPLAAFPQPDGSRVIVASNAGRDWHPSWFHNLQANPATLIELPGPDDSVATVPVKARIADEPERDRLFTDVKTKAPNFAEYEQSTTRRIPIIVLDPVA